MRLAAKLALPAACAATATAQLSAGPIIAEIAPGSKTCDTSNPDCRTADQAGPWIAQGMIDHKIYDTKEMAAIISLMAFESVDFKYKHNISPGRPGQGTANMQMANFNLEYAKSIDELHDKVKDIKSVDGMSDDQLNHLLSLVTPDEFNFGSGPWFLTTHCADVRDKLRANVDDGFQAYMACVGVEVTNERKAYLERAKKAFKIQ